MNYGELYEKLKQHRESLSESHAIRLHRAASWLKAAEAHHNDEDIAFITAWIAFNSCYAIEGESDNIGTRQAFSKFAQNLASADKDNKLYDCIWLNFSGFVRTLIDNQYVFSPFWESQRQGDDNWKTSFDDAKKVAYQALANNDLPLMLSIVLDRLYILRNQLIHGGATYQSSVNRQQVKDGHRFMMTIMPLIIETMLQATDVDWGEIYYPVV